MEQIRQKLITFEGKAKSSRVKAVMKWWSKCISMVIAKTASRNVAFKSGKMMDALFQGQSVQRKRLNRVSLTLTSKAWLATRSCTFLIRMIGRNRLGLISATFRFMQYMLCKFISAKTIR